MREQTAVLDKVILVNLDVNLWSGRTKVRPKDLVAVEGKLPPSDLASLGHKKTIDPADLRPFNALKKEMERTCLEVGTRFLGGYAIPQDQFDNVARQLNDIVTRAGDSKYKLLANYDARIEGWISKHSKWASIIRRAVAPSAVVASRIKFDWTAVRVTPATTGDGELAGGTADKAGGLGTQLFKEVAQSARETYSKSYEGKSAVGQRAIRPIKSIRKKMESLRFLDRRIGPICQEVDTVLELLPKTGNIEDGEFLALRGLVILLSDEDAMRSAGTKALESAAGDSTAAEESDSLEDVGEDASQEKVVEAETPEAVVKELPVEPASEPEPKEKKAPSGWFF